MTEKNLKIVLFVGWVFFIALIIGRAIGIIVTHDDVTTIGEFFNRLAVWDFFYILVFALLITGSIAIKKKANKK